MTLTDYLVTKTGKKFISLRVAKAALQGLLVKPLNRNDGHNYPDTPFFIDSSLMNLGGRGGSSPSEVDITNNDTLLNRITFNGNNIRPANIEVIEEITKEDLEIINAKKAEIKRMLKPVYLEIKLGENPLEHLKEYERERKVNTISEIETILTSSESIDKKYELITELMQ